MDVVQVTATVRNPAALERFWDGLFLVDAGSVALAQGTSVL